MLGEFVDVMANIEYGLFIAIGLDAVVLLVIAVINSNKKLNVISYTIAAVLLVLLTFQMSSMIGACKVSNTTSSINEIIGIVSPTLNKYVSSATRHELGWFIFRRIMWSLLFVVVASWGILATMDKKNTSARRVSDRRPKGRRYDSCVSRRYR